MIKRIFIFLIILMTLFTFAACNDDPKGSLAKTPEEEYDRIAGLDGSDSSGNALVFDFRGLEKIQISQTVTMESEYIQSRIDGKIEETALYQLDKSKSDDVVSILKEKRILSINFNNFNQSERISYNNRKIYFKGNASYENSDKRGEFSSFGDYLNRDLSSPYHKYQKAIRLFDRSKLINLGGTKTGGTYTVHAKVNEQYYAEFFDWAYSFSAFIQHKDLIDEYSYVDTSEIYSAELQLKTAPMLLEEMYIKIVLKGKFASDERITFISKSDFKIDDFTATI